jgi:hypothetical protein
MKVKNLIFGDIAKIEYTRISGEDYYPSSFDTVGNVPMHVGKSLFYKIGNLAFDLIGLGCYKIVKYQETYPNKLKGKKVVMFEKPFSELSIRESISRREAVLLYRNSKIK